MRIFVAGGNGMLGTDLLEALDGENVTAPEREELDITDTAAVAAAVRGHDVVINAAAYTRVDDAESHEAEAFTVNATGAYCLATAAARSGARLVQLSTDYVFDGATTIPYAEDHPVAPLGAYGRSKAEGERLVLEANPSRTLVVRTAWLYGTHGSSLARSILDAATRHPTVRVVTDQIGQPTWTVDLAQTILGLLRAEAPAGIYHVTNSGETSWFEFARTLFARTGLDPARVLPTTSESFRRAAARPHYSVLRHDALLRAGLPPPRPWGEALAAAIARGVFV